MCPLYKSMTEAINSIITHLNCALQLHEFNYDRQEFDSSNMFNVFILTICDWI